MHGIKEPNLPEHQVTVAVSALPIEGIQCISPPEVSCLPPALRQHADLQLCHLGGRVLLAAPEVFSFYKDALSTFGFEILCGETNIGSTYPADAAYNIARVGNAAFLHPKIADPVALRFFEMQNIRVIPVRQGYTKCAVVPVDDRSLITADAGIARAARCAGFSVLEIQPGGVTLAGFPYGFLGGAAGKTAADAVYVTGALSAHPSKQEIFVFLQKRGIKIRERHIPIPIDIGSVLPLMET
ncbi:MAG: hypothetical protein IJN25_02270 [Clostridia bacterium]|nr:hypothetical protein [Oscillospiraceae bacterium]MBQ7032475.1 hypothetical protein [Clostridia bacterium]